MANKGIFHSLTHLPGYRYCGPGTKGVFSGDNPINDLDAACQRHDQGYSKPLYNKSGEKVSPYFHFSKADEDLLKEASTLSGPAAAAVRTVFGVKKYFAPRAYSKTDIDRTSVKRVLELASEGVRKVQRTGPSPFNTRQYPNLRPSRTTASRRLYNTPLGAAIRNMPYRRRSFKRRAYRRYTKPTFRTNYKSKANFCNKLKQCLTERRYYDVTQTNTDIDSWKTGTSGTIFCLNDIAQGTGLSNRFAREIKMMKIRIKGYMSLAAVASAHANRKVRIMLVYDKRNNQGATSIASVLTDDGVHPSNNEYGFSYFQSLDNVRRYDVLYDKIHTLKSQIHVNTNVSFIDGIGYTFKITKNLNMRITRYNAASAGTSADQIEMGSLWLMMFGDIEGSDDKAPLLQILKSRLAFLP